MRKRWSVRMLSLGPVYIALETKCTERSHISRAWIKEVAEPFRTGHGWRVRLGHYALQCGTCTKNPDVSNDIELFRQHMFMRWVPYLPEAPDDAPGQGRDEGAGDDEVRTDEPEPVLGDGVVQGRDVPDLLSEHVEGRGQAGRGSPGGQEDGPQEGGTAVGVGRGDAGDDRPTAAQDGQGA